MTGKICDRYWMRPMTQADMTTVARWFEQLADLSLFDRRIPLPLSSDGYLAAWGESLSEREPRTAYWFAVEDSDGALVGISGLQDVNYVNGDAVFPIFMVETLRLKGIGTRVGAAMLDLAFSQLRLRRVTSYCRGDNHVSRHMTDSLGFREEGRLREAWYADGYHHDITVIGILAKEWLDRREALSQRLSRDVLVSLGRPPSESWTWPPATGSRLEPAASG
ncbi:MAG: GNAT family protein [Pseudomonadota bacterium]